MNGSTLPQPGQRVKVHYHLRRGDFSVTVAGRVIANVSDITLTAVAFRVQPAGLERIRRLNVRQVCAYATGLVAAVCTGPDVSGWRRVTFNPFRADTFTLDGEPVWSAPLVVFTAKAGWVTPVTSHRGDGRPSAPTARHGSELPVAQLECPRR